MAAATAVSPTALATSGATSSPESMEDVMALTFGIAMDQAEAQTLQTLATDVFNATNPTNPAGLSRALSSAAQTKIQEIETALKDFPVKKSLAVSADLSTENFGQHLDVTAAKATLTASAVTTNGEAIASNGSNFKSASGEFSAALSAKLTSIPTESAIKAAVLNANLAAKASVSGKMVETTGTLQSSTMVPDVVTAEYASSVVLALSVNKNGNGGKIVLRADASGSGTVSDYRKFSTPDYYKDFNPVVTVTLTVYKDDGSKAFEKVWNSVDALMNELQELMSSQK